jgi:prevent-host-death family protein
MPSYTVTQAKNALPSLIDKARAGEEVVITCRGNVVAEVLPRGTIRTLPKTPFDYEALRVRREARGPVSMTSVEILNAVYGDPRD